MLLDIKLKRKMSDIKPPGPPDPPKCRHGKVMNRFKSCPECLSEDKKIRSLVHPLIDEYWESKGEKDLYHIVFRAYHMGMRNEHETI